MILTYIYGYLACILAYQLINALISGYYGESWEKKDFVDSLLWPIMIMVLIGLVLRIAVESIKNKKSKEQ